MSAEAANTQKPAHPLEQDAEVIRAMIRHENELTNHRTSWLLTVEGLLFAALGFAWDKTDAHFLIYILSGLGVALAACSATGMIAAQRAIDRLAALWKDADSNNYQTPDVVGYRAKGTWLHWFPAWRWFPWLFVVGWIFVGILNYTRPPTPPKDPISVVLQLPASQIQQPPPPSIHLAPPPDTPADSSLPAVQHSNPPGAPTNP